MLGLLRSAHTSAGVQGEWGWRCECRASEGGSFTDDLLRVSPQTAEWPMGWIQVNMNSSVDFFAFW